MIGTLAGLHRLRQHLRDAVANLRKLAEGKSELFDAAALAKLTVDCRRLDRKIERLAKDVLAGEPPSGAA